MSVQEEVELLKTITHVVTGTVVVLVAAVVVVVNVLGLVSHGGWGIAV